MEYIAEQLQESLLPSSLPEIPGVEAEVEFRPAGERHRVGGDFYDLFPGDDRSWAVLVGDVCGKGASAAAVTGLARYTLRAGAVRETRPSRTLALLNEAILRQRAPHEFCSVAFARLEPNGAAGVRATVSNGGHPLPLVLRSDGTVETVGAHGTLLGVVPDPVLRDEAVELRAGDGLVLYTDGLTDAYASERIVTTDTVTCRRTPRSSSEPRSSQIACGSRSTTTGRASSRANRRRAGARPRAGASTSSTSFPTAGASRGPTGRESGSRSIATKCSPPQGTATFGGCKSALAVVLGRSRTFQVRHAPCVLGWLDFRSPNATELTTGSTKRASAPAVPYSLRVPVARKHMSRDLLTVAPDLPLDEMAKRMVSRDVGAALVTEGDRLVGIVTERDVLRAVARGLRESLVVADCMTSDPETMEPDESIEHAAVLMIHGGFRHLPITEGGEVVGMLSIRDLMRIVLEDSAPRGA